MSYDPNLDKFPEEELRLNKGEITTGRPLQNFGNFSSWKKEDIHEFNLHYKENIFGDNITAFDKKVVNTGKAITTARETLNKMITGDKDTEEGKEIDNRETGILDDKSYEKQNEEILRRIEAEYEKDPSIISRYLNQENKEEQRHLITISKSEPFSVTLSLQPRTYNNYTMVRTTQQSKVFSLKIL